MHVHFLQARLLPAPLLRLHDRKRLILLPGPIGEQKLHAAPAPVAGAQQPLGPGLVVLVDGLVEQLPEEQVEEPDRLLSRPEIVAEDDLSRADPLVLRQLLRVLGRVVLSAPRLRREIEGALVGPPGLVGLAQLSPYPGKQAHIPAAKRIDGLFLIPYDEQPVPEQPAHGVGGDRPHDSPLQVIGVLEFVDHDVEVAAAQLPDDMPVVLALEERQDLELQVLEIQVVLSQFFPAVIPQAGESDRGQGLENGESLLLQWPADLEILDPELLEGIAQDQHRLPEEIQTLRIRRPGPGGASRELARRGQQPANPGQLLYVDLLLPGRQEQSLEPGQQSQQLQAAAAQCGGIVGRVGLRRLEELQGALQRPAPADLVADFPQDHPSIHREPFSVLRPFQAGEIAQPGPGLLADLNQGVEGVGQGGPRPLSAQDRQLRMPPVFGQPVDRAIDHPAQEEHLVHLVHDPKVRIDLRLDRVLAQQAGAEGVEGTDLVAQEGVPQALEVLELGPAALDLPFDGRVDPLFHLYRGLVGKGDHHQPVDRQKLPPQDLDDPASQDLGLARAGSRGDNQVAGRIRGQMLVQGRSEALHASSSSSHSGSSIFRRGL